MVLCHVVPLQLVVGGPAGDDLLVVEGTRSEPRSRGEYFAESAGEK